MSIGTAALAGLLGSGAGLACSVLVERLGHTARPPPPRRSVRRLVTAGATAALFAAVTVRCHGSAALPAYLYLAAVSVALARVDIEQGRLPDVITLPSYPVGLCLLAVAAASADDGPRRLGYAVLGMAGLWTFYAALFLIHPQGMGWGDVKLAGVCGMYLGWLGVDAWIVGTFLAFVIGAGYGMALVLARRAGRGTAIPFGPFMLAGVFVAVLGGAEWASVAW